MIIKNRFNCGYKCLDTVTDFKTKSEVWKTLKGLHLLWLDTAKMQWGSLSGQMP